MSPLPDRDRLKEYAIKAVHLGLREVAMAPEQVQARRLREQARQIPAPQEGAPRVLFVTPRDWAVHVQWESVMAQALRLRGADVSFLTCGGQLELCDRVNVYEGPPVPCHTCTRYVHESIEAHGFARKSIREGWLIHNRATWPELDQLSLDELFEVTDRGLPLGRLVSIPVRWFLMRSVLTDDPLAALTARRFLRSARQVVDGLSAALDALQPDVVCVLNGLFFFESIALELCRQRGIRTFCYERGFITGTIITHHDIPDLLLDVSHRWTTAKEQPLDQAEEARLDSYIDDRRHGRRTIDQYWTKDTLYAADVARPAGSLAVLFTNLTWDSAVLGQEVAFPTIHDWLSAAIDWFSRRPDHQLLVRIHPAELKLAGKQTWEPLGEFVRERFPELPTNVRVIGSRIPTSSYTLMEACDFGVVLTSTTGLELALQGKPVIVAGRTHYRDKGFTVDVSSPQEFVDALERIASHPGDFTPRVDLVRRYANLFFFDAPISISGVEEHVIGLARLTISDLSELSPGKDAAIDRLCESILGEEEFPRKDRQRPRTAFHDRQLSATAVEKPGGRRVPGPEPAESRP